MNVKTKGYIFGIWLLVLVLVFSMTACAKKSASTDTEEETTETTVTTTEPTAATTTVAANDLFPRMAYVNATTLRVRPTASTVGEAIGGLKWGDAVKLLSRDGDWYAIEFIPVNPPAGFSGNIGYVHSNYVQDTPPTEMPTE